MNLEDIAKRAGVSRSTVSRVVNDEPYVSAKTREKVLAVIAEVGYAPNPGARMMVTQRTHVIGVVIPQSIAVVFEDPHYFPTLLQGISEAAHKRDYATLLWLGSSDEDEERFYDRMLRNRLMDGLLVASATNHAPIIQRLVERRVPFVMVESPAVLADQISYITVDNVAAAMDAVGHLIDLGRRRIGTITGSLSNTDALDRVEGYKQALRAANLKVDKNLIVEGHFSSRSGYLGMKALLQQDVDAVFAASDTTAYGAMQALVEAGVRVPEEVAVVGFDDLPRAQEVIPPLTTVRQPIQQKGYQATNMLLDLIEGVIAGPKHVLLPTQLVIRQSTGMPGQ
jgi:LacI family transcriptional regulator